MCENCLPFNEVGVNDEFVDKHCVGYSLYSCMLAILRVLLNLTHENSKLPQSYTVFCPPFSFLKQFTSH